MIEVMIERWTGPGGGVNFRWSVWRDGHRVQMGRDSYPTAEAGEADAREFCVHGLGREPDRVTRL